MPIIGLSYGSVGCGAPKTVVFGIERYRVAIRPPYQLRREVRGDDPLCACPSWHDISSVYERYALEWIRTR